MDAGVLEQMKNLIARKSDPRDMNMNALMQVCLIEEATTPGTTPAPDLGGSAPVMPPLAEPLIKKAKAVGEGQTSDRKSKSKQKRGGLVLIVQESGGKQKGKETNDSPRVSKSPR